MTSSLRYFPMLVRPEWSRNHGVVGSTDDRWQGSGNVSINERSWGDLASISIRCGGQSVTFYGSSIRELKAGLSLVPSRITDRNFLPSAGAGLQFAGTVYNHAHPVLTRGSVFQSSHPANPWYANSLEALVHNDGKISAVVFCRRPWCAMYTAFAPGFLDAIQCYLTESRGDRDDRR